MKEVILLVLLIAAMISDIRSGKIPNGLIVFGWMLACIIQTGSFGMTGGLIACKDAICLIGICLPVFLLHAIGAGDIKLWSVLAAMQGLAVTWQVAVVFFVLAGSYSLIRMLQQKIFVERFYYLVHFVHICMNRRCFHGKQCKQQDNTKQAEKQCICDKQPDRVMQSEHGTGNEPDETELRYYDKQRDGTGCTIKLAPFTVIAYMVVLIGRWTGQC